MRPSESRATVVRFTVTRPSASTDSSMRSVFTCSVALPLLLAALTAMPDWYAIGVATMRITTSTSETSMSGVMLGS